MSEPEPFIVEDPRMEWGSDERPSIEVVIYSENPHRIPIGFRPADSTSRWGEAIWTARDLTREEPT